jgi:SAM-dependent methyltransferase
MSITVPISSPDLTDLSSRQRLAWSSGDYAVVGARIHAVAERLTDDADLHAGWRVLDIATGSGNAAIAAARLGAEVVGVDYVPELLDRARERTAAERLAVELIEADAQSLPFPDGAFDAAVSVFGVMFAADQALAAGELLRVVRPGGTIALASWRRSSFVGDVFDVVSSHVTPAPGTPSPFAWGSEIDLRLLIGGGLRYLQLRERTFTFRDRTPEQLVDMLRLSYGPTVRAFEAVGSGGRPALEADLLALVRRHNRLDDAVSIPSTYLEAIGRRR